MCKKQKYHFVMNDLQLCPKHHSSFSSFHSRSYIFTYFLVRVLFLGVSTYRYINGRFTSFNKTFWHAHVILTNLILFLSVSPVISYNHYFSSLSSSLDRLDATWPVPEPIFSPVFKLLFSQQLYCTANRLCDMQSMCLHHLLFLFLF